MTLPNRERTVNIINASWSMVNPSPSEDPPRKRGRVPGPSRTMRIALKRIVLPALRARGFEGELPDLRRVSSEGTHFFEVQTNKYGGSFIVNLGRIPPGPFTTRSGELVSPHLLTIDHARGNDAARLRAAPVVLTEVWFQYGPSPASATRASLRKILGTGDRNPPARDFDRTARAVLTLLPECDQWWAGANGLPHVRSHADSERAQHEAWNNRPRKS